MEHIQTSVAFPCHFLLFIYLNINLSDRYHKMTLVIRKKTFTKLKKSMRNFAKIKNAECDDQRTHSSVF